MASKRYRSRGAAERAKNRIEREIPQANVEIHSDNSLTVYAYTSALSPSQRDFLAEYDHREPAKPSPSTPLLAPHKYNPPTEFSKVPNAKPVAYEILDRYRLAGMFHERKKAIAEIIEAGVAPNTASAYYTRYRREHNIPGIYRRNRIVAADKSPVDLSAKPRPTAVRVCNGVAEPVRGTLRREVWDMADKLHEKLGRPPMRGEVAERIFDASAETIKRAYINWRKFHNIPRQPQYHRRRS